MIVAFQTESLRRVCENESVASEKLGTVVAAHLRERLADIRAATTVSDLPVGNPRIRGACSELLLIDLGPDSYMTWISGHVTPRTKQDGTIDWSQTTRIRLLEIGGL